MDVPKSPRNVDAHDVQPEECGEERELQDERCGEKRCRGYKTDGTLVSGVGIPVGTSEQYYRPHMNGTHVGVYPTWLALKGWGGVSCFVVESTIYLIRNESAIPIARKNFDAILPFTKRGLQHGAAGGFHSFVVESTLALTHPGRGRRCETARESPGRSRSRRCRRAAGIRCGPSGCSSAGSYVTMNTSLVAVSAVTTLHTRDFQRKTPSVLYSCVVDHTVI